MKRILQLGSFALLAVLMLTGCSESEVASYNVSKNADQFKVMRQITFIDTMTGDYLFTVTGNCSITVDEVDKQLEVVCKTGNNNYQKHFFGISETTTYVVEELGVSTVDPYHYQIVWRPETIVPDVEIDTSATMLLASDSKKEESNEGL